MRLEKIIDFLYPIACLGCGQVGRYICKSCIGKQSLVDPCCLYCEKPAIDGMTHVKCMRSLRLDGVTTIWVYKGSIKKSLKQSKYRFAKEILNDLADCASFYLKNEVTALPKNAICVSVPIHPARYRWRGFNQVDILAKRISGVFGWQYVPNLMIRNKSTKPQSDLSKKERKRNVKGAFSLGDGAGKLIKEEKIVVFDDIATSGSTLSEVGKVLKRNGSGVVWGLTLAGG
jgi:ComF family protein